MTHDTDTALQGRNDDGVSLTIEPGDRVEWVIGEGRIHERRCVGTVERTGVEKFGYDDIIVVDSDTSDDPAHIRPEDVERVHE